MVTSNRSLLASHSLAWVPSTHANKELEVNLSEGQVRKVPIEYLDHPRIEENRRRSLRSISGLGKFSRFFGGDLYRVDTAAVAVLDSLL